MANPQPEKHTRFSNELLEIFISIVRFLSPYEIAVWLCIFRKTYGYKKKDDWISLSQIEKMTGIRQPHVARSKKKLLLKNMLISIATGVGIQKDYDKWTIPKWVYLNGYIPKQVKLTQTGNSNLPKQVIEGSTQTGRHNIDQEKDQDLTKETLTKETKTVSPIKEALKCFGDFFKESTGSTYHCSFAKDTLLIESLLKSTPLPELKTLMRQFFLSKDSFITETGYTIGVFYSQICKLKVEMSKFTKETEHKKLIQGGL